jgi:uncharacterized protein YecT (DUF1311 family)
MQRAIFAFWIGVATSVSAVGIFPFVASAGNDGAKTSNADDELSTCLNSGDPQNGVMSDVLACYAGALAQRDSVINATYRDVIKRTRHAERFQLRLDERRWIYRRDQVCKDQANEAGGMASQDGQIVHYGCLIAETDLRIIWLKNYNDRYSRAHK